MGRFARLADSMAANAELDITFHGGGSDSTAALSEFDTVELTTDVIEALYAHCPDEVAVTIRPNKEGGGIENGVDLLRAIHSSKNTHAFEMRNVNERVGFQYVMGTSSAQNKLVRQLEGFYPDSHIEVGEYPHPPLLPLTTGWYMAGAAFRLRRRDDGEHLYPIRHMNNEGFENDPYNSITSEMVGDHETDETTNVALQVAFEPAPTDWYKGRSFCGKTLEKGIDDLVDELKHPHEGGGPGAALNAYLKHLGPGQTNGSFIDDVRGTRREATDEERLEAKFLLTQRGEKGYGLSIRVFAVGDTPEKTAQRVQETAAMFEGYYDSTTEQGFEVVPLTDEKLLAEAKRAYARERSDRTMTMGLTATSGLMHIPNESINTQHVEWSLTSHAGDVPADATRFSDEQLASVAWQRRDRSHHFHHDHDPDRPDTDAETMNGSEIEVENQDDEDTANEANEINEINEINDTSENDGPRWQYDIAAAYDESEHGPPKESSQTDSEDDPTETTV